MRGLKRLVLLVAVLAAVGLAAAFPASASATSDQCDNFNGPVCSPDIRVPLDSTYEPGISGLATGAYVGHPSSYSGSNDPVFGLAGSWSSGGSDPGRFGNDFSFGAHDGISADVGPSGTNYDRISPQQPTVAAWVKATSPGSNRNIVVRGTRSCDGGFGAWGLVTGPAGGLQFYAAYYHQLQADQLHTPEVPAAQIWDGQWHAIAGVYDGGPNGRNVMSLWIDGRQASAIDLPFDSSSIYYEGTTNELIIGGLSAGEQTCIPTASLGFEGAIDEVDIFHRALTPTQLAGFQSSSATGNAPPDVPWTPNVQGPSMSGTPKVGNVLTCNDRDGMTSTSFTWERAPRDTHFENDASWTPINGATTSTYTVQAADAGSRVRCHEYGTISLGEDPNHNGSWAADRASTSLRADVDAPVNTGPPFITGDATLPKFGFLHINPLAAHTLTCNPGTWENGPEESAGDFTYVWLRNGLALQGPEATQKTYTIKRRYDFFGKLVDPQGDGDRLLSCIVYAKNDVGGTAPVPSSNDVLAIDRRPYVLQHPKATLSEPSDGNPLHRHVDCDPGNWRYDYAARGIAPYQYKIHWYRSKGSSSEVIAGATDSQYTPTVEDLGRELGCTVKNENPAGYTIIGSNSVLIKLPEGPVDSKLFHDGGNNGADPTNLMAISNEYKNAIDDLVRQRLRAAVDKTKQACSDGTALPAGTRIPDGLPDDNKVGRHGEAVTPVQRCQILLHAPVCPANSPNFKSNHCVELRVFGGVRWQAYPCKEHEYDEGGGSQNVPARCPSLGIEVPSIDPSKPPSSGEDIKALEKVTPQQVLWDINADGITDAICPASAPVLRTILNDGRYQPRAVIVTAGSAATGHYNFAGGDNLSVVYAPHGSGDNSPPTLRDNQVKVCATSFDPPPDPNHGPCVTAGTIGRVNITGNLCPVDVRKLNSDDYSKLLGGADFKQLRDFLFAASEDRVKNEGLITARRRKGPAPIVWAAWGPRRGTGSASLSKASAADKLATGIYENTAAAMSAYSSPYGFQPPKTPNVDAVNGLKDKQAGFALDQIYVSNDPLELNGVTQAPLNGVAALLVPSDAHSALPDTNSMVLAARDAASHLGPPDLTSGLPLSTGGVLKSTLSDIPQSPNDVLRETNLDQVQAELQGQIDQYKQELQQKFDQAKADALKKLQEQIDKLDLGPFKLAGNVKVHAQNDGSANIEANAEFPLLKGPDGKGLAVGVTIHADLQGHLALRGLQLTVPSANLGALQLQNITMSYNTDAGLSVTGKITVGGGGVDIKQFQIGPKGQFLALNVDYLATPPGIGVGPGLFLAALGGGLDLPKDLITAHAVLSAGPATGGGCPTAGIDGQLQLHFGDPVALDANATVKLLCIPLGHMTLHADTNGLFKITGDANFDVGPIYASVKIGGGIDFSKQQTGALKIPPWQFTADGDGGIRDLLTGQVHAVLSNAGIAGCGRIEAEVPLIGKFISLFTKKPVKVTITIAGGASLRFIDDLPPFDYTTLIANLDLFLGCDIDSSFYPLGKPAAFREAGNNFSFTVPKNAGATAFSIEGAGGAPRIKLRDPKGHVYDFTHAVTKGKPIGNSVWGKVLESADKTVVLVGDPAPGTWTAIPASGSPKIVRVRAARLIPHAHVTGHVSGHGLKRTLAYNIDPISGQVVRFVEFVNGGQKLIATVRTGGKGHLKFTPAESTGTHRTIVAQVSQGGLPRNTITVARYVATGPKVGLARHIRVHRKGHKAIITWKAAPLGASYEVGVRSGDGKNLMFIPKEGVRRVVVTGVSKNEGLRITIIAFSPRGYGGRAAHAKLNGNMMVGKVRHLPPLKKKHKKH